MQRDNESANPRGFQFSPDEFDPDDPNECPECGGEKDCDEDLCDDCAEELSAEIEDEDDISD